MKHFLEEIRKPIRWTPPFMTSATCWSYLDGNVKRATKPDVEHELYTDDRDCMRVEQAVDTDTKGFGGEPIEDNIEGENKSFICNAWHKDAPCEKHCGDTSVCIFYPKDL